MYLCGSFCSKTQEGQKLSHEISAPGKIINETLVSINSPVKFLQMSYHHLVLWYDKILLIVPLIQWKMATVQRIHLGS